MKIERKPSWACRLGWHNWPKKAHLTFTRELWVCTRCAAVKVVDYG